MTSLNRIITLCWFLIIAGSLQSQTFQFAKGMGASGDDYGYSIATDINGNSYTTGYFRFTVDFDPGPGVYNLTAGGVTAFILKMDAAGNFVWVKMLDGVSSVGYSVKTDPTGNIYLTGAFGASADFDPGPAVYTLTSTGGDDVFILKLDNGGNFLWAKKIGWIVTENGLSIYPDRYGNVLVTGFYGGTVDFDPGPGTFTMVSGGPSVDIFILKLNSGGNFVWAKGIGNTSTEWGRSITADTIGNVYTSGYYDGTVDFDPGPGVFNLTGTFPKGFVLKLDSSGSFIWAKDMGAYDGRAIVVDNSGSTYTTGYFQGTCDFDPGPGHLQFDVNERG